MRLLLILLCLGLHGTNVTDVAHDFHISRTLLAYNTDTEEWQISMHLFIDDLELALEQEGYTELRLGTAREQQDADTIIDAYIRKQLQLQSDDTNIKWEWIGKEVSEDLTAFWIYLLVPNAQPTQYLQVRNELFFELYEDQQNMLQVDGGNGRIKRYLLHRDEWQKKIDLGWRCCMNSRRKTKIG